MLTDDWIQTVRAICNECKMKNVPLTLIGCLPVSDYYLLSLENYDEYIQYLQGFAEDLGVHMIEFNRLPFSVFSYSPKNFYNEDHLSAIGSKSFESVLIDVLRDDYDFSSGWKTAQERLEATEPAYYGLRYETASDALVYRIIANKPDEFEFRIHQRPYDSLYAEYCIQNFSSNIDFSIPLSHVGKTSIDIRSKKTGELLSSYTYQN